MGRQTEKRKWD